MEIKLLRQLFEEGVLLSASVAPAPMSEGKWVMTCNKANGATEHVTRVRDNHVKHYRSLVGAIADAKHIGFQEIKLIIP
ncbi:plasmid replication protein RepB [Halomonas sp. AOP27-A1-41]|uniref:plasmid replication protein RepB n=1 Tax=Halomonas sp. AOP27-A1-41 TaxID=3457707 RepID=UPI004034C69A